MTDPTPALFPAPAPEVEKPHQLVLTPSPTSGGVDLQVICPGPTWRCEEWEECPSCYDPDDETLDALEAGRAVHGELHDYLDYNDAWCVRTGRCYVPEAPDLDDQVTAVTGDQPGTYLVTVSFPDDQVLKLTAVQR